MKCSCSCEFILKMTTFVVHIFVQKYINAPKSAQSMLGSMCEIQETHLKCTWACPDFVRFLINEHVSEVSRVRMQQEYQHGYKGFVHNPSQGCKSVLLLYSLCGALRKPAAADAPLAVPEAIDDTEPQVEKLDPCKKRKFDQLFQELLDKIVLAYKKACPCLCPKLRDWCMQVLLEWHNGH